MRIRHNAVLTSGHRQIVRFRLTPESAVNHMAFSANSRADAEDAFFTYCQRRGLDVFEVL